MNNEQIGVIVARFQVAELHEGHRYLINEVVKRHEHIIILLGVGHAYANGRDPLSYEVRASMVAKAYPNLLVHPVTDHPSNEVWSLQLDGIVEKLCPGKQAVMYGSRDSFLRAYSGKHETYALSEKPGCPSGTVARKEIVGSVRHSTDFRAGIIYAHANRPGIPFQTVDVAIVRPETREVLLGWKKQDGERLRFIGGFVDTTDTSLEYAAKREAGEEAPGVETDDYRYLGSFKIDDWRYRGTPDAVMTVLFQSTYIFGHRKPGDDLDGLTWVSFDRLLEVLIPAHQEMGKRFLARNT